MKQQKNNEGTEILGYAEFGAYLHRDQGGKAKIAAYTSVNKPLTIEAHDETTKIASRRYKIIEEEKAILDDNKFYQKDIWNEQEGSGKTTTNEPTQKTEYTNQEEENNKPKQENDLPAWGKVLKNLTDKTHDLGIVGVILAATALLLAGTAIGLALI